MKKLLILCLAAFTVPPLFAWKNLDYSRSDNWFICDKAKSDAAYDVFYLYPTLSNREGRIFLDFNDRDAMKKAAGFIGAQNGILGADARVFAPKVRQLEYHAIFEYARHPGEGEWHSRFMAGVHDAENAFRFYRKHFQNGRPFILFGHSQGAMELYELLKNDRDIALENGFAAAYLIGLPQVTVAQIQSDLQGRGIAPAKAADDLAVIIVWNTQSKDAENSVFTVKNGYCINPLNWKTDGTFASAQENQGAFFYDYRNGTSRKIPHFCGAYVDCCKGALIVDLPANSRWDANGFMGKGVFHMNDVWFFAENLKANILLRVKTFNAQKSNAEK